MSYHNRTRKDTKDIFIISRYVDFVSRTIAKICVRRMCSMFSFTSKCD